MIKWSKTASLQVVDLRGQPPSSQPAPLAGEQGREELRAGLAGRLDRFLDRVLDAYMAGEGQQAPPPDPPQRSPTRNNIQVRFVHE